MVEGAQANAMLRERGEGRGAGVAAVLLLPVYGEKVRQGLRGSANSSDLGAAPHLPAGILSP